MHCMSVHERETEMSQAVKINLHAFDRGVDEVLRLKPLMRIINNRFMAADDGISVDAKTSSEVIVQSARSAVSGQKKYGKATR